MIFKSLNRKKRWASSNSNQEIRGHFTSFSKNKKKKKEENQLAWITIQVKKVGHSLHRPDSGWWKLFQFHMCWALEGYAPEKETTGNVLVRTKAPELLFCWLFAVGKSSLLVLRSEDNKPQTTVNTLFTICKAGLRSVESVCRGRSVVRFPVLLKGTLR